MSKFIEVHNHNDNGNAYVINISNIAIVQEADHKRKITLNISQGGNAIDIFCLQHIVDVKRLINSAAEDYLPLSDVQKQL